MGNVSNGVLVWVQVYGITNYKRLLHKRLLSMKVMVTVTSSSSRHRGTEHILRLHRSTEQFCKTLHKGLFAFFLFTFTNQCMALAHGSLVFPDVMSCVIPIEMPPNKSRPRTEVWKNALGVPTLQKAICGQRQRQSRPSSAYLAVEECVLCRYGTSIRVGMWVSGPRKPVWWPYLQIRHEFNVKYKVMKLLLYCEEAYFGQNVI